MGSVGRVFPVAYGRAATHSSIPACRILWTEEPDGLQFGGRKELDTTERLALSLFTLIHIFSIVQTWTNSIPCPQPPLILFPGPSVGQAWLQSEWDMTLCLKHTIYFWLYPWVCQSLHLLHLTSPLNGPRWPLLRVGFPFSEILSTPVLPSPGTTIGHGHALLVSFCFSWRRTCFPKFLFQDPRILLPTTESALLTRSLNVDGHTLLLVLSFDI